MSPEEREQFVAAPQGCGHRSADDAGRRSGRGRAAAHRAATVGREPGRAAVRTRPQCRARRGRCRPSAPASGHGADHRLLFGPLPVRPSRPARAWLLHRRPVEAGPPAARHQRRHLHRGAQRRDQPEHRGRDRRSCCPPRRRPGCRPVAPHGAAAGPGRREARRASGRRQPGRRGSASGGALTMPVISVRDLKKTYQIGGEIAVQALRGINVSVEPGEFVAVTGPSGSGKSTFMHILGCLDRPTAGVYVLDGRDVSRLVATTSSPISATRRSASSSRASTCSRARRALENVELPLLYSRGRRIEASERAQRPRGGARRGRARRPRAPSPEPAVGRPAAARRHRPRARHRRRRSCSPTSRPATSTRARASRSWTSSSG